MSTAEVADVLTFLDWIKHATVYGVHIPGNLSPGLTFSRVLLKWPPDVDLQIRRAEQEWPPSLSLMSTLTPSKCLNTSNSSCQPTRGRVFSGLRYERL